LPDAGSHTSVIPKGETETIFASADRVAGNITTAEFDMKGAVVGIFVQDGRVVDNSSRVIFGTPVTWTTQDQTDCIDANILNGVQRNPSTSSEMIWDWGSIATRTLSTQINVATVSLNPANSITIVVEFSDDDVSYGSPQTIGSTGGAVNNQEVRTDLTAQSFRYTKIRPSVQANSTRATIREIWEITTIGGASDLTFEARDTERSDWKVISPTTAIPQVAPNATGATFPLVSQIGQGQINEMFLPTADVADIKMIRAVLTTSADGVSNTSVVLIKVNTHV